MWGEKDNKKRETIFQDNQYTFIAKDAFFKGKANFKGTVRVDGEYEGEITTTDTLIIGEHAVIKATVEAETIICGGKVEGSMTASQKVQLLKPAVVIGDVHSPSFSVEEGVLFHGTSDMGVSSLDDVPSASGGVENVHDLSANRDHRLQSQDA